MLNPHKDFAEISSSTSNDLTKLLSILEPFETFAQGLMSVLDLVCPQSFARKFSGDEDIDSESFAFYYKKQMISKDFGSIKVFYHMGPWADSLEDYRNLIGGTGKSFTIEVNLRDNEIEALPEKSGLSHYKINEVTDVLDYLSAWVKTVDPRFEKIVSQLNSQIKPTVKTLQLG